MPNTMNYDALLPELTAIPDDVTRAPSQPADSYAQEAENLFVWVQTDRAELEAAGLDWTLVEALPVRAGALREAQSRWYSERFTQVEAARQWAESEPGAYDLRGELLATMRYAYRNHDDLLGRVSGIANGSGHADLIQDLNDIAVLGRRNPDPLTAIGFDLTRLDEAATLSSDLAELLALREGDATAADPAKTVRDQAFTHLKQAVDEIRACGRFVFRGRPNRGTGYVSAYGRRFRSSPDEPDDDVLVAPAA